jgi:hypothetical protein
LLSILGFGETLKKKKMNLFAVLLILILLIWIVWPEKDIRYILLAYVSLVYFGLIFLNRFNKRIVMLFLLITLLALGNTTYKLVEANTYQNLLFEEAGHWLNENTPEDARILAHSYRQVNFFSHRMTVQPPPEVQKVERYIEIYNTSYAVVDTYEKYTPRYMYTYFDRYELVKTFKKDSNEIKIYKLTVPTQNSSGINTVILTFDFESSNGVVHIPKIMNILKEHEAHATFFVTGEVARNFSTAVREINEGGVMRLGAMDTLTSFPYLCKKMHSCLQPCLINRLNMSGIEVLIQNRNLKSY